MFVGFFCIFHMLAVAVYAVPGAYGQNSIIRFLQHHFSDSIRPYILITSQWQSWPLFAPDPLRRVSEIQLETREPGSQWEIVENVGTKNLTWWRHSKEVKLVDRIFREDRKEMRGHYMRLECNRANIHQKIPMRARYKYYVIPKHTIQASNDWWKNWEPEWHEETANIIVCNHLAS